MRMFKSICTEFELLTVNKRRRQPRVSSTVVQHRFAIPELPSSRGFRPEEATRGMYKSVSNCSQFQFDNFER
jgi:hypothetical protein